MENIQDTAKYCLHYIENSPSEATSSVRFFTSLSAARNAMMEHFNKSNSILHFTDSKPSDGDEINMDGFGIYVSIGIDSYIWKIIKIKAEDLDDEPGPTSNEPESDKLLTMKITAMQQDLAKACEPNEAEKLLQKYLDASDHIGSPLMLEEAVGAMSDIILSDGSETGMCVADLLAMAEDSFIKVIVDAARRSFADAMESYDSAQQANMAAFGNGNGHMPEETESPEEPLNNEQLLAMDGQPVYLAADNRWYLLNLNFRIPASSTYIQGGVNQFGEATSLSLLKECGLYPVTENRPGNKPAPLTMEDVFDMDGLPAYLPLTGRWYLINLSCSVPAHSGEPVCVDMDGNFVPVSVLVKCGLYRGLPMEERTQPCPSIAKKSGNSASRPTESGLLRLWMRAGIDLLVNSEEASRILGNNNKLSEQIVKKVLRQGRFQFDGNSYIPESVVREFNAEYHVIPSSCNYAEPEFDLDIIDGFTVISDADSLLSMPSKEAFENAQICLKDNGVSEDETALVLQALFYILFSKEVGDLLNFGDDKQEDDSGEV